MPLWASSSRDDPRGAAPAGGRSGGRSGSRCGSSASRVWRLERWRVRRSSDTRATESDGRWRAGVMSTSSPRRSTTGTGAATEPMSLPMLASPVPPALSGRPLSSLLNMAQARWMRVRTSSQVGTASDGLAPARDCPDAANPEASIMRTGRREASFAGFVRGIGVEPLGALVEVDPARAPVSRVAEPALDVHPPRLAGLRVGAHQQYRLLRPHPVGDRGAQLDLPVDPGVGLPLVPDEPHLVDLLVDQRDPAVTSLRADVD